MPPCEKCCGIDCNGHCDFDWKAMVNTGIWYDNTDTRFCWDGVEVAPGEFMDKVRGAIERARSDERERCVKIIEETGCGCRPRCFEAECHGRAWIKRILKGDV